MLTFGAFIFFAGFLGINSSLVGVASSTWYNYISTGSQRGRVSRYTVERLSKFSGLPEKVFTGEDDFTEEHKDIFGNKVQEFYKKGGGNSVIASTEENSKLIVEKLKKVGSEIDGINSEEEIKQCIDLLQKMLRISENKRQIIEEKKSF